jgi:hypothetical protein
MCLWRTPEKYIAGAALDRAGLDNGFTDGGEIVSLTPQENFWYISVRGWVNSRVTVLLE